LVVLLEALKCDPGKALNLFLVGELTPYKQSRDSPEIIQDFKCMKGVFVSSNILLLARGLVPIFII